MEEIDKNLKRIEDRLEKLNKEKEELAEYYNLDKERRSLHHALLTQKIRNLDDELQSIKNEKAEISSGLQSGDGEKERLQESEIDLDSALQNLADRLSEVLSCPGSAARAAFRNEGCAREGVQNLPPQGEHAFECKCHWWRCLKAISVPAVGF
jgi:seryl-tRNA synthetase